MYYDLITKCLEYEDIDLNTFFIKTRKGIFFNI